MLKSLPLYPTGKKNLIQNMELKLNYRKKIGKEANRKLQSNGKYPAIVYGGKENIPVYGSRSVIDSFFLMTGGKTQVIDIEIDKEGKYEKKKAIVQDYQYSNIKKQFIHIDFLEVTDNTVLHLEIPIRIVGSSQVVQLGGIIQTIRHSIPVICQAKDIPDYIEVDITDLEFGSSIHVLDVNYPQGVKPVVTGRNFTLLTATGVAEETAEEQEVDEEEVDASKVEAVKQKDTEEKEDKDSKDSKDSKDGKDTKK